MKLSKKEWLFILSIICILNFSFFITLGFWEEGERVGLIVTSDVDYSTYLVKAKIGYDGNWQYVNKYTTEEHQGSYIFILYILIGHIAKITGLSIVFLINFLRIIFSIIVLAYLLQFFKKYSSMNPYLCVFLAVFISGFFDFGPQFHLFTGFSGYLHYVFELLLILFFIDKSLEYLNNKSKVALILCCLSLMVLTVIHPFIVTIPESIILVYGFWNKKFKDTFIFLLINTLFISPVMSYFFYIFTYNEMLTGWRSQALPNKSQLQYLFVFEIGSVIAYLGLILIFFRKIKVDNKEQIFIIWIIVASLWALTKVITANHQFLFFICVPISVLSLMAITFFVERLKYAKKLLMVILILFMIFPSYMFFFVHSKNQITNALNKQNLPHIYLSKEDNIILQKLPINEDTILLTENLKLASLIPFYTDGISYIGHFHETLNYEEKKEQLNKITSNEMSEDNLVNFLKQNNIRYLVINKETQLKYSCLELIKQGSQLKIFQLKE